MLRRELILAGLAAGPAMGFARAAGAQTAPFRELTAQEGRAPLYPGSGSDTAIWGFDGSTPGPLLRVRQGEDLRVRLINRLAQPTSIHWHGMRVPNAMDGVAGLTQDAVPPGGRFDYAFRAPDAGTFWYHAHNRSWEQMARGLYGPIVVEEPDPPPVDQDLTLVIDDWRLDASGAIHAASFGDMHDWAHGGRLGNWVTVNGQSGHRIAVSSGQRVRLRLLNAANARIMTLAFPKHDPVVIALDGQPTGPSPLPGGRLRLAPGQRADLVVDMGLDPGAESPVVEVTGEAVAVAHLAYGPGRTVRPEPLPPVAAPAANPLPNAIDLPAAVAAELRMEGGAMGRMAGAMIDGQMLDMRALVAAGRVWAFNGVAGRPDRPLLRAAIGQTVAIDMINDTRWPHAMHLHGHHFVVVRRGGRAVEGAPWRDTELLDPGERATIAFVADAPGSWLLHCHMLEHQAGGMVTWIEIA